ncbi:molybdopterin cofactor-binding domain-containing protein [Gymnodinialimonas sp. 2305UL16-5]|uniref:xanthine dehydrogenase family protein molybdopterin-binding subunit n=1 Tax=Gymnodinialimonas mytili TaxID=3126503 RepID=UPI003096A8A3
MSRAGKIARRTFLIGSAAIAGGVAFGIYAVRRPHDNPLADGLAEGEATFNPWVKISSDGITLITPHVDVGQGVASAQALLIAEEMDLDMDQFQISFGRPAAAYYNTALAAEAVPFMATDEGRAAETMRSVMNAAMKVMGMQTTGGSTTIPDSFDKLRQAGAVARETLKLAAAQQEGVDVAALRTEGGAVILPDGRALPYTDLAEVAATIEPVAEVALRDPSDWRLIGQPIPRLDMVAKSTGTQDFGIDLRVDGMVHAAVRINPRQGGEMLGFEASAAREMRGVVDVLEIPGGIAVIADNTWRAMRAADAVEIEWGPAPYPAEQDAHWDALSNSFTDDKLDQTWRDDGDVESALDGAETIEAEYRSPYVAHAPLEPLNALIRVDPEGVEVWTGHQMPRLVQTIVGRITGHDADQVTLHNQFTGGSFGHRLELEYLKHAAHIARQLPGTPVKLTYSREEDFAHDFPRHIAMGRGRGSVANGQVQAMDLAIAAPSVMASQLSRADLPVVGPDLQIAAGAWNNPYALPHYRMRAYRAAELAPVSSWRAVGSPGAGFVFDSFLDELIHAAGADPLEERIRLMDHQVSRQVLERVGEIANWTGPRGDGQGRGVAFVESFGVPFAQIIDVTATDRGIRIDHVFASCDAGTIVDPVNFESQVQGGIVWALGHAMNCEITYSDGMAEQSNYHAHEGMRIWQVPQITLQALQNNSQIRGLGEPMVPPAAPALANAIFAATGQRIREMPFNRHIDFI